MATKEERCPNCGKNVTVEADTLELFCVYCGTKFEADIPREAGVNDEERVMRLYDAGDFDAVIRSGYDGIFERSRTIGLLRQAASYFEIYKKYVFEATQLGAQRSVKSGLGQLFLGRDSYGDDPIHKRYFDDVRNCASELARLVSLCEGDACALGKRLALDVCRSITARKTPDECGSDIYWPLAAAEHCCLPLLSAIETCELLDLYSDYGSYYKKYERLPNQIRVCSAMADEIASRGERIPTIKAGGIFGRIFR
ncbi:MAG: hypothetical protein RR998_09105 [Oscillospiraceae bacterium]